MRTVNFTPKACTDWEDDKGNKFKPTFKGLIVLRVPTFKERQKLKAKLLHSFSQGGETSVETLQGGSAQMSVTQLLGHMSNMADLIEETAAFFERVELENLQTGLVYKSFEDLGYDKDAEEILSEVAKELAGGLALSKN